MKLLRVRVHCTQYVQYAAFHYIIKTDVFVLPCPQPGRTVMKYFNVPEIIRPRGRGGRALGKRGRGSRMGGGGGGAVGCEFDTYCAQN